LTNQIGTLDPGVQHSVVNGWQIPLAVLCGELGPAQQIIELNVAKASKSRVQSQSAHAE